MTETIFTDVDRSPATVENAERRLRTLIRKRDAAQTIIGASRSGPNLPTPYYVVFKIAHGNFEADVIEARRDLKRAAMIYRECKRQEWMATNARKPTRNHSITELNAMYFEIAALDDKLAAMVGTATERELMDAEAERDALESYWSDARINWDKRMAVRAAGREPPKSRKGRTAMVDGVRTKIEREYA
jgi:hypothetical protein